MSNNILSKYKAYYATRAKKYSKNPKYKHTFAAEKKLSDAMQSCATLDEFRDKIGNLNELCGIALIKDQQLMMHEHFKKHQEHIRAKESEMILENIDQFDTIMDLLSHVNDVSAKISIQISMDESHPMLFYSYMFMIDNYLAYSNAEVPDKYKNEMKNWAEEIKLSLIQGCNTVESNNNAWQQGWKFDPDMCFEARHFNLSPLKEQQLREVRETYRNIIER